MSVPKDTAPALAAYLLASPDLRDAVRATQDAVQAQFSGTRSNPTPEALALRWRPLVRRAAMLRRIESGGAIVTPLDVQDAAALWLGQQYTDRRRHMAKHWTTKDAAKAWVVSTVRVREFCQQGRVPGARQRIVAGRAVWLLPINAPRPEQLPGGRPPLDGSGKLTK